MEKNLPGKIEIDNSFCLQVSTTVKVLQHLQYLTKVSKYCRTSQVFFCVRYIEVCKETLLILNVKNAIKNEQEIQQFEMQRRLKTITLSLINTTYISFKEPFMCVAKKDCFHFNSFTTISQNDTSCYTVCKNYKKCYIFSPCHI